MASKLFTTIFFFFFLFQFLFSLTVASPLTSISSACEILCDTSGYFSMGLTLELATKDLPLEDLQELTIFAPSDQAFSRYGQPSLLDLKYQLSPTRFTGDNLLIPTLRSNSTLIVTNSSRSGGHIWINNVAVQDSPLFDDGLVVIYGSDEFFASLNASFPNLILSPESIPDLSLATRCAPIPNFAFRIFESASSFFIYRGGFGIIMATFLTLQRDSKIAVFALN